MAITKVTSGGITDATIATADIADDAVTNAKIAAGAVGGTQLGSNAVSAAKIGSSEVTAAAIAAGAVGTAKIADNAVTAGKLASGVQTTINNNANNRVITGSDTANTLNSESALTFNNSTDTLQVHQTDTGNNPAFKSIHRGGSGSNINAHFTNYSGTDHTVILHDGSIGVGTQSPIGTLDVYDGSFVLSKPNSSGNERNWRFLNNNVAAGNLGLQVSTAAGGSTFSNVIEIISNGRVGIGDTNPQSKLAVSDGGSTADPVIMAHVANSNGGFLGFGLYSTINSAYTFKVSNNGRVTAKEGIIFGTDTAAANVLDDYEEGTWTPEFDDAYYTSPGTTYNSRAGSYIKIGRMVLARFHVNFAGCSNSNAGPFISAGLPFTPDTSNISSRGLQGTVSFSGIDAPTSTINVNFGYHRLDNNIYYLGINSPRDNTSDGNASAIQAGNISNGDTISGTVMYMSAT